MGPRKPVGDPVPPFSGAGNARLWVGVSSGDMVTVTSLSRHTLPLPQRQMPVPPKCPKTGVEPLTLGTAARWSPGAPPLLGFQNADWPASQPIPHHAPWESSSAQRAVPGFHLGMGEMSDSWAWVLRIYTIFPPRRSEGSRVVTFSYLSIHRNLSLSASLWEETIT